MVDPGEWWGRRRAAEYEPGLYAPELPDPRTHSYREIVVHELTGELEGVDDPGPRPLAAPGVGRRLVLYRRATGYAWLERREDGSPVRREFWIYGWSDRPGEVEPPPGPDYLAVAKQARNVKGGSNDDA